MKPRKSFVRASSEPACSPGQPGFVDSALVSSQEADT